jgi:hypothetical protein
MGRAGASACRPLPRARVGGGRSTASYLPNRMSIVTVA